MTDLRTGFDDASSNKWKTWGLRPIVLFAAAYTIIGILHELAHALTAYALNVPSTLFCLELIERAQVELRLAVALSRIGKQRSVWRKSNCSTTDAHWPELRQRQGLSVGLPQRHALSYGWHNQPSIIL